MASYLDYLSYNMSTEDDDDKLPNDYQEKLCSLLFSNPDYVNLVCTYRHTGQFDCTLAEKAIMYMFQHNGGVADITSCCKMFAESWDMPLQCIEFAIRPLFSKLIKKFGNL